MIRAALEIVALLVASRAFGGRKALDEPSEPTRGRH